MASGTFKIMAIMGLLLLGSSVAYAVPTLIISDGNPLDTVTVVDNGAGDTNASLGDVSWAGTVGEWTINVAAGITKPEQGSATIPSMDFDYLIKTSGAGTLTATWSDTGFGPLTAPMIEFLATWGVTNPSADSAIYTTYQSSGSTVPATGLLTNSGTLTGAASGSVIVPANFVGSPFVLTQELTLTATGKSNFASGDLTLDAVPEPSALLLLGSGLLGFGFLRLRKRG